MPIEPSTHRAAASRDPHLTLRRVERQQELVETLYAANDRLPLGRLAGDLGVSVRTVSRDLRRLRESGLPIEVVAGVHGGVRIGRSPVVPPLELDLPEVASLIASLAALGPTSSASSASAMRKLVEAITISEPTGDGLARRGEQSAS